MGVLDEGPRPAGRSPASLRKIEQISFARIEPNTVTGEKPSFEWVDPSILLVDETYQRNIAGRSQALIKKIVHSWDWKRFKPPIVAVTDEGLEVIDGQHTAIAAATHPAVEMIPVMVIGGAELAERAAAFIGHNRDRISVTQMQLHTASVAAASPEAMRIERVARAAGLNILRAPPVRGDYRPGDTMAIGAIKNMIGRQGETKAIAILKVLRAAESAPVSAAGVRAVEALMCDEEFSGKLSPGQISETICELAERAATEAHLWARTHRVPLWRALAAVIFRRGVEHFRKAPRYAQTEADVLALPSSSERRQTLR